MHGGTEKDQHIKSEGSVAKNCHRVGCLRFCVVFVLFISTGAFIKSQYTTMIDEARSPQKKWQKTCCDANYTCNNSVDFAALGTDICTN